METISVYEIAATSALLIFIYCNFRLLTKAAIKEDVDTFAFKHVVLVNFENLLMGLYILAFPFSLLWILHGLHTVCALITLFCYLRKAYEH